MNVLTDKTALAAWTLIATISRRGLSVAHITSRRATPDAIDFALSEQGVRQRAALKKKEKTRSESKNI